MRILPRSITSWCNSESHWSQCLRSSLRVKLILQLRFPMSYPKMWKTVQSHQDRTTKEPLPNKKGQATNKHQLSTTSSSSKSKPPSKGLHLPVWGPILTRGRAPTRASPRAERDKDHSNNRKSHTWQESTSSKTGVNQISKRRDQPEKARVRIPNNLPTSSLSISNKTIQCLLRWPRKTLPVLRSDKDLVQPWGERLSPNKIVNI